jgi:hypothetical protein
MKTVLKRENEKLYMRQLKTMRRYLKLCIITLTILTSCSSCAGLIKGPSLTKPLELDRGWWNVANGSPCSGDDDICCMYKRDMDKFMLEYTILKKGGVRTR